MLHETSRKIQIEWMSYHRPSMAKTSDQCHSVLLFAFAHYSEEKTVRLGRVVKFIHFHPVPAALGFEPLNLGSLTDLTIATAAGCLLDFVQGILKGEVSLCH
jgi:hypothetical protein